MFISSLVFIVFRGEDFQCDRGWVVSKYLRNIMQKQLSDVVQYLDTINL